MIELDQHEVSYLSICRHFREIYKTVKEDETDKTKEVGVKYADYSIFLLISTFPSMKRCLFVGDILS